MGVFLSIIDTDDEEIAGVDFGSHEQTRSFLEYITCALELGVRASRFPNLMSHLQESEDWEPAECDRLKEELGIVRQGLEDLPEGDRDEESTRFEMLSMVDDLLRLAKQASARKLGIRFQ